MDLVEDIVAAQSGDLQAYGRIVKATESMVFAVAQRVLGWGWDSSVRQRCATAWQTCAG